MFWSDAHSQPGKVFVCSLDNVADLLDRDALVAQFVGGGSDSNTHSRLRGLIKNREQILAAGFQSPALLLVTRRVQLELLRLGGSTLSVRGDRQPSQSDCGGADHAYDGDVHDCESR